MKRTARKTIRILVVDDHPVVRRGLASCLAGRPPLKVVGEAGDGEEAVRKAVELNPDIMLVDINMPRVTGFEMLETFEAEGLLPNGFTSVVMFSSSNRPADHDKALSFRSVIGYVEKALTVESYERVTSEHGRLRSA